MNPALGQAFAGGMLPTIPPNATQSDTIAAINSIINKLNTWDGVVVQSGTVEVPVTSAAQNLTTIPHGLGYLPVINASINNLGLIFTPVTGPVITIKDFSLPLPNFLAGAQIVSGGIAFDGWMTALVDETNIYFFSLNGTGNDLGIFDVTYYLQRISASQN